ncbi:hypothetical protein N5Q78_22475 [Escherichia coli]|nr:hypothetical protein [Escherichia coli]
MVGTEPSRQLIWLPLMQASQWPQQRAWLKKNVLLTPSGRASALAFMMTLRADRRYKDAQPLPLVT